MATRKVQKLSHPPASEKVAVDRISRLPDSLIHHILSFVPTIDAVRMSLLSKRWRRMWYSVPALDFSEAQIEKYFPVDGHKRFFEFFENCMNRRKLISDSTVTRFKLETEHYGGDDALDEWVSLALRRNLEELDLRRIPDFDEAERYYLPEAVLSAKSLTVLKLDSLILGVSSFSEVSLPCLKYLSLTNIELFDSALHLILPNCPSLENLILTCTSLSEPRISSSSLRLLQMENDSCQRVRVEADRLEDFVYSGYCKSFDLSGSKGIRNFTLLYGWIGDKSLEDLIFGLPLLENLSLCMKFCLKRVRIRGLNLKSIKLDNRYNKEAVEATIEAPNLASFCYTGDTDFSLSMESPMNLSDASFVLRRYDKTHCDSYYMKLITFLSNIYFSWKSINIHVWSDEDLIIPENLRKICQPPWPDLKHLKVKNYVSKREKSELKEALCWISPSLQTLDIKQQTRGYF